MTARPAMSWRLRLPPQTPMVAASAVVSVDGSGSGRLPADGQPMHVADIAAPGDGRAPLVTCIMPTCDRLAFARNAVRLFEAQDYRNRELVVVGDSADRRLQSSLPADPRIRYLHAPVRDSIGMKRNRACAAAAGEYIAHWDDDDWYGPGRLSAQLEPLLAGRADVSGLLTPVFFDLASWQFWGVTPLLHRRLFREDMHGGTLVYRRAVWERLARYPDASLAEDAQFLIAAKRRGARLVRIPGDGLFVYVRHGRNAWSFTCGEHGGPAGWLRAEEPPLPPEDRAFYVSRRLAEAPVQPKARRTGRDRAPLVSCIMPTKDRRRFISRAIAYFVRQDYANRELLVLDDGDDPVGDLVPVDPRIRYVRLDRRLVLGEKRNHACRLARGSVIVHWDDDDWHAASRISYQVEQLRLHGADLCGPRRLLYLEPAQRRAWRYDYPADAPRPWVAGSALCYRIESWRESPFDDVDVGEDSRFVRDRGRNAVAVLDDHRFLVGLIHQANSNPKLTSSAGWRPRPLDDVRVLMGRDYRMYEVERPAPVTVANRAQKARTPEVNLLGRSCSAIDPTAAS